ncbi:MAG: dihydroneopterin aldolase family protein [Methanomassiliicoccales archaeon]
MTGSREIKASKYFNCTARERAVFEAGIKLGTVYHQFVGTPVASSNVESLERAMEDGLRVQPFVEEVKVTVDRSLLRHKRNEYDYQTLSGSMFEVRLTISIEGVRVVAMMKYLEELNYPLMFVQDIVED